MEIRKRWIPTNQCYILYQETNGIKNAKQSLLHRKSPRYLFGNGELIELFFDYFSGLCDKGQITEGVCLFMLFILMAYFRK